MSDSVNNKRKPLSKRIRFEVFKRDSFKCQYCGASAPDVLLHADHIKPVVEGGTNDITNLITSCLPCNLGKSDKLLNDDSAIKKRKTQLDDLQERREQLDMMMEWAQGLQDIKSQAVERLVSNWNNLAPGFTLSENGRQTIRKWIKKYTIEDILSAMEISASQYLIFDKEGNTTEQSWINAFKKVNPILSIEQDAKSDPDLKELLYIRGMIRNRCDRYEYDNATALEWLRSARTWGITMPKLKQVAYGVRDWSHFRQSLVDLIEICKAQRQ